MNVRRMIRLLTPPALLLRKDRRSAEAHDAHVYDGDYRSWQEALDDSGGYDDPRILRKILDSMQEVRSGQAAFERDGTALPEMEYSWPMVAGLMWAAACTGGCLSVIDFGGSLGSSYFQLRRFFRGLTRVRWHIVEQSHVAAKGRAELQTEELRFHADFQDAVDTPGPHVVLLSGVLQYLENPFEVLDALLGLSVQTVVLDRTTFHGGSADKLCVQRVDHGEFMTSYPAWFFSTSKFRQALACHDIVAEFTSFEQGETSLGDYKGFIVDVRHDANSPQIQDGLH